MLMLVESARGKNEAQANLRGRLERSWRSREKRLVVWRPDSRAITIYHNGRYWFGSIPPDEGQSTPRYWNPFGAYRAHGNFQIAVELNIPTTSNSKRVSGFFAKDSSSGHVYLMHDGSVGGGRKGVGRAEFLDWSDAKVVSVVDSQGGVRHGIVVAPVNGATTAADLARFVQQVIDFKEAIKNGEAAFTKRSRRGNRHGDYYDEFSGKKRKASSREVEYISRHGDIVRALRDWRAKTLRPQEHFFKNDYVDLGVEDRGVTSEVYEVKPSCARQSLYTAIGQILVHDDSPNGESKRILVLPRGEAIPPDVMRALDRGGISLVRFALQEDKVRILAVE
jgi:hypothetical protein